MLMTFRKFGIAVVIAVAVAATSVALPSAASARWGGGWHGGHGGWHGGYGGWHGGGYGGWHGGYRGWRGGYGGWGWGGFGWGLGAGLMLGAAPYYYGGYYGYAPYPYYYGRRCYITRRWVWNRYGHRVRRRVEVCY